MKIEFFILLITGFIVMNIYHDGKYLKMIKEWKNIIKWHFIYL